MPEFNSYWYMIAQRADDYLAARNREHYADMTLNMKPAMSLMTLR
jgi:hypothetical protein